MTIITSNEKLQELCTIIGKEKIIAFDTEFLRDKTYFPKLCLIQLAYADQVAIIDPLAPSIDLSPLLAIFDNQEIIKILHAPEQDLSIIHRISGKIPTPIFDTQVAAMLCGMGRDLSYESLSLQFASAKIDKTHRYTDWSQRPLADAQIEYAFKDVAHLIGIYHKLVSLLKQLGRYQWLEEEMLKYMDAERYKSRPDLAWLKIKVKDKKPMILSLIKELAEWRELTASRIDIPRAHLLTDISLVNLATRKPDGVDKITKILGASRNVKEPGKLAREIQEIIIRAKSLPISDNFSQHISPKSHPSVTPALVPLLKALLKLKSAEYNIAESIIASDYELNYIANNHDIQPKHLPALQGWRMEVFGRDALNLKQGKILLGMENDEIKIIQAALISDTKRKVTSNAMG